MREGHPQSDILLWGCNHKTDVGGHYYDVVKQLDYAYDDGLGVHGLHEGEDYAEYCNLQTADDEGNVEIWQELILPKDLVDGHSGEGRHGDPNEHD
jgi:hypothetical protein